MFYIEKYRNIRTYIEAYTKLLEHIKNIGNARKDWNV